jgi:prepilin-type N-terminal cleavage/methylation domain-containing protein
MRHSKAFSLVELMIVVAIIAILAAIAIPAYVNAQLKAKRAEVPGVVHGIKLSQLSYDAQHDAYLDCSPAPRARSAMDKSAVPWDTLGDTNWRDLGWTPDGDLRGVYETNSDPDPTIGFMVIGTSDVDDDDLEARYEASRDQEPQLVSGPDTY